MTNKPRHCGVVTDKRWCFEGNDDHYAYVGLVINEYPKRTQDSNRRIYSDEIPMADENTILRIKNRQLWQRDMLAKVNRLVFWGD